MNTHVHCLQLDLRVVGGDEATKRVDGPRDLENRVNDLKVLRKQPAQLLQRSQRFGGPLVADVAQKLRNLQRACESGSAPGNGEFVAVMGVP